MDPSLLRVIKATAAAAQPKSIEDKLAVFFKGEFLAVRNAEGGFYICQVINHFCRLKNRCFQSFDCFRRCKI